MKFLIPFFLLISMSSLAQNEIFETLKQQYSFEFDKKNKLDSIDLSSKMSEVKNQGVRNTCSAFASTALAEFVIQKDLGKTYDLSEAYAYYNAKKTVLSNSFLKQSYEPVDGLCGYLAVTGFQNGCMEESEWIYDGSASWKESNAKNCKTDNGVSSRECHTGVPPQGAKTLDINLKIVHIPLEEIDEFILSEKRPVVVNIWIYKNGMDVKTGALTIPDSPVLMGGHVVLITGYNKKTEMFSFKNSWSKDWGENGYGTMSKKYLLEHFEANNLIAQIPNLTKDQQEYATKVSMGASAYTIKN
ncbi:C1 family peptidase [uncultured Psychroserpens sp.]|uniref:C1 family peptidase n=1 Tax=uncultured Psychroserpens sp. TaxID=255436 RepID=UPI0026166E7F|nr:C1 family peptidase [uncultured Psychroserpens sp.]